MAYFGGYFGEGYFGDYFGLVSPAPTYNLVFRPTGLSLATWGILPASGMGLASRGLLIPVSIAPPRPVRTMARRETRFSARRVGRWTSRRG